MIAVMTKVRQRREFLAFFLPIAAISAASIIISALFLSSLFIRQSTRILQEQESYRLRSAMRLFSRIHLGSIPSFILAMEDGPVRDYVYGRNSSKERVLRALDSLDRTLLGNEFLDSFYIYNHKSGFLSTVSGWEQFDYMSDPGLLDLFDHIGDYGLSRYIMRRVTFPGNRTPKNLFTFILGYIPEAGVPMKQAFVANLSERHIREALSDDGSPTALYILDKDGKFLSHPDADRFGTDAGNDLRFNLVLARPELSGTMIVRDRNNNRWIASWMDQPEIRWRFISFAAENVLFAPVLRIRDTVIVSVILLLITAFLVVYILSLRMSDRERRLRSALAYLRGELDLDVPLTGGLRADGKDGFFPALHGPCGMAMVVAEKECGKDADAQALNRIETGLRDSFMAHRLVAEVLRASGRSFVVLYETGGRTPLAVLGEILTGVKSGRSVSLGAFLLAGPIGIHDFPDGYRTLKKAYRLDYLRSSGSISEVGPSDTDPEENENLPRHSRSSIDFSGLEKAIRLNDTAETASLLDDLFAILRSERDPDLFRYVMSALSRLIPELLGDQAETLLEGGSEEFKCALSKAERLDQAELLLRPIPSRLTERGDLHAEKRKRELIERVKTLVESRMGDRSLGTAAIASEVGLSTSYLRDLFRQTEGVALLEYVGSRRHELAKKLLLESKAPVREVCEQAGFINYSYFFTYFKKSTGLTPGEFREIEKTGDLQHPFRVFSNFSAVLQVPGFRKTMR